MRTHVCLVSAQAAPNLLPTLDPLLKPDQVVLLISGKMQPVADSLAAVLGELGIKVRNVPITNEHDHSSFEHTLLDIATTYEAHEILLNLTGGTKLMALVAQSVAVVARWRSFYVDVDTDTITWLDRESPPQRLGEQLRLRHYLRSYGFELPEPRVRPQINRARRDLTQTLISQIGSLEAPITQLNWLAQQAEEQRRLISPMNQQQQDSRSLEALLRHCADADVLQLDRTLARQACRAVPPASTFLRWQHGCAPIMRLDTAPRPDFEGIETVKAEIYAKGFDASPMTRAWGAPLIAGFHGTGRIDLDFIDPALRALPASGPVPACRQGSQLRAGRRPYRLFCNNMNTCSLRKK